MESRPSSLVQFWHEDRPPDHVSRTLGSFRECNPRLAQLVFSASTADAFIANHCGRREVAAFRACAPPAMQADYFRYCAVYALGGVYADANFSCLGDLSGLLRPPDRGVLFGREDPVSERLAAFFNWPYPVGPFRAVSNGLFGFGAPRHPFLGLAVEIATANIEHRVADGAAGIWLSAGPGVFTSLYLLHELGSFDAFLEYSSCSVLEPSAQLVCDVVSDYERIPLAFGGIEIRPASERDRLAVKEQGVYRGRQWYAVRGSIFRESHR